MDRIDIMQSQNFEFLRSVWPELAGFAEHYASLDPQSAQTKLRNFAERSVAIGEIIMLMFWLKMEHFLWNISCIQSIYAQ